MLARKSIGNIEVDHATAGTITSSPGFIALLPRIGLERMLKAIRFAEEPELTIIASFEPIYLANKFSNLLTFSPMVKCVERRESTTSVTSSQLNEGTLRGILYFALVSKSVWLASKYFFIRIFI